MKGWTTALALLMASLAQAASLQQAGNGDWMQNWVECTNTSKGREYDLATVSDFLANSGESSVFSPICSELNVLLQACAGEYGQAAKDQSTDYMNKLMGVLKKMDGEKLKASNIVYIPADSNDMCPKEGPGYSLRRYTREEGDGLCIEHKKWVEAESHNKLESSLGAEDFTRDPLNRIYASLVYFKDQWHKKFIRECTKEGDFRLGDGETVPRQFMNRESRFPYKAYEEGDNEFDMVAVPYVSRLTRYMVYLIPRRIDANLSKVWESFYRLESGDIWNLLHTCPGEKVDLTVPRIESLRSDLDLKKILKNTYGSGPAIETDSKMTACIDVDEEGTTAVAFTITCCSDCIEEDNVLAIKADRSHIAFVYDMTARRILFVVKDMGCAGAKKDDN